MKLLEERILRDGVIKEEGNPDTIFTCPHDPSTIRFLSMVL